MKGRELATRIGLHRVGRAWRGACPACGYPDAFALTDGKLGPIGWCASCGNRDAIARIIGDPSKAAALTPPHKDAFHAQARLERAERIWRDSEVVIGTPAAFYLETLAASVTSLPAPSCASAPTVRIPTGCRNDDCGCLPSSPQCATARTGSSAFIERFCAATGLARLKSNRRKLQSGLCGAAWYGLRRSSTYSTRASWSWVKASKPQHLRGCCLTYRHGPPSAPAISHAE